MAKDASTNGKYGSGNVSLTEEGEDIVIRLNKNTVLHAAGTLNKAGKERKRDLVATTGGFASIGGCQVSLNVTQ